MLSLLSGETLKIFLGCGAGWARGTRVGVAGSAWSCGTGFGTRVSGQNSRDFYRFDPFLPCLAAILRKRVSGRGISVPRLQNPFLNIPSYDLQSSARRNGRVKIFVGVAFRVRVLHQVEI